jgi:hypothetical protein
MSLAGGVLDLSCRRRNAAPGSDELVIEGAEAHLLLGAVADLVGETGTGLILDTDRQGLTSACVSKCHFQCRDPTSRGQKIIYFPLRRSVPACRDRL